MLAKLTNFEGETLKIVIFPVSECALLGENQRWYSIAEIYNFSINKVGYVAACSGKSPDAFRKNLSSPRIML